MSDKPKPEWCICGDSYEERKATAADKYAAKNGLVDPAKFYAFLAGADWALANLELSEALDPKGSLGE